MAYMESNSPYNYQASNQPYHRVDSGIGSGAMIGAAITTASAGAADFTLSRFKSTKPAGASMNMGGNDSLYISQRAMKGLSEEDRRRMGISQMTPKTVDTRTSKIRGTLFGRSRLGKLARYAGYGLAGASAGVASELMSEQ